MGKKKEAEAIVPPDWKVGDYAIKDGHTLVRLNELFPSGRFGVEYVQIIFNGEIIHGGGSFAWDSKIFSPLKSPKDILAAKKFEASRMAVEHQKAMEKCFRDATTYGEAVKAIVAAEKQATPQAKE